MRLAHRIPATFAAALTAALSACAGTALAADASGGTSYGAAGSSTQDSSGQGTGAFSARPEALLDRTLHFRGTVSPGQDVEIQRFDPHLGWLTVARATADGAGRYLARWKTDHIGVITMREVGASDAAAHASAASPSLQVTVFKQAKATWYGPGLYGHRTACGERLTRRLVGVAHRGLPCGRQVAFLYHGRTVIVPVVDRGPFAHGASWDLTAAAAKRLGFSATGRVGAVSLRDGDAARLHAARR